MKFMKGKRGIEQLTVVMYIVLVFLIIIIAGVIIYQRLKGIGII